MAQRVVIVGGGFGGLYCARRLHRDFDVTLIDRRNFHLFQPLLYQVATGSLSPANIAVPLRALLRKRRNVRVLLGEAVDVDLAARELVLDGGEWIGYDVLVAATGSTHAYFGHDEWEELAPGLKTIEDATDIRRRVLGAFEQAERTTDPVATKQWLTFVIVGGGPTGVELAGAIAEIARDTLRGNFRRIDPASARIILVEGQDRVLASYPFDLSLKAQRKLAQLGVELRLDSRVVGVEPGRVAIQPDSGGTGSRIETRTVLWAAGVRGTHFGEVLAQRAGIERDRLGRLPVNPDLTLAGHDNIFVIGDLANYAGADGYPLPGVAQVAMQQGKYVAELLRKRQLAAVEKAAGSRLHDAAMPFRYRDLGTMATIGRAAAVCDLGSIHLSGFIGWAAWLFIHLLYIVQFQNKLLVIVQWAWSYFTLGRSARLITGEDLVKPVSEA
jgi:NADH dehydrogenase